MELPVVDRDPFMQEVHERLRREAQDKEASARRRNQAALEVVHEHLLANGYPDARLEDIDVLRLRFLYKFDNKRYQYYHIKDMNAGKPWVLCVD